MLAAALRNIYERRYNPRTEIDAELFEEVSRIFDAATDAGFSGSEAGGDFMEQLRTNNAVFAAFKTHRPLQIRTPYISADTVCRQRW